MKRLLLAGLALCLLPAYAAPSDFFPLRQGDSWKYQSTTSSGVTTFFDVKVTAFDPASGRYTVQTVGGPVTIEETYSKPAGQVDWHRELYVEKTQSADFKPVRQFLENPLKPGDSWTWSGTGLTPAQIDEQDSVVGSDTITVAAGTFTATHVHVDVTIGGAAVRREYWYADHVGLVKSATDNGSLQSNTVLVNYSFK